ncbi:MAG: winged helix-turn-helix domain-containing protein [Planctomycetota bacterium]|nr:winged helix-turn-helix domain-containing protein [Planctomycetota bacterium]
MLVRHAGKVVTHRQLLHEVCGPKSSDQKHYVRVYMTHLRRKLEAGNSPRALFETETGVGYRLREDEPSGSTLDPIAVPPRPYRPRNRSLDSRSARGDVSSPGRRSARASSSTA